jgi:hypothetical protein
MKIAKMSFAWFMVSLALGALLVVKWNHEKQQQTKIEQLQLQLEDSSKAVRLSQTKAEEQEKESAKIRSELRASEMEAYQAKQQAATAKAAAAAVPQARQANAAAGPAGEGDANPIAAMLKNPEMRKMIQAQQSAMINMMYGPLFKKLGLTTEESDKVKAILAEAQGKATENAGAMFDKPGESKTAAIKEIAQQQQDAQNKIKELLGDDRYQKFQEYSQTMGERMMMGQFQQQQNLPPEKVDQLLDLIRQEKQAAQLPDMTGPNNSQVVMDMMNKPGALEKMLEQQNLVNQRVAQKAGSILSPEELEAFQEFQKNQANLQQVSLKAAVKMMQGPGNGAAPEAPGATPQAVPPSQ